METARKILKIIGVIIAACVVATFLAWFRSIENFHVEHYGRASAAFLTGLIFHIYGWKIKELLLFMIPNILIYLYGLYVSSDIWIQFTYEIICVYSFAVAGYYSFKFTRKSFAIFCVLFLLLNIYMYVAYPYHALNYFQKKDVEDSIGDIKGQILQKEYLLDKDSNLVYLDQYKNKVIVADFWFSGCVICFQKHRMIEEDLSELYKDKDVVFLFINSGTVDSYENFLKVMNKIKVQNTAYIKYLYDPEAKICDRFDIYRFPTELVIYNDTIREVSSGYDMDSKWLFKKELKNRIDKYLK